MCLKNNAKNVKDFISKNTKNNKKWIKCYKVVSFIDGYVCGYFHDDFKYKPGWNISDSRTSKVCLKNIQISKGIHVLLESTSPLYNCIQVYCHINDLIGVSYDKDSCYFYRKEAVFRKIYIEKKEFNKAKNR